MPRAATHRLGGLMAILPGLLIIAATVPSPALATAADWQIRQETTLTEDFHGTIEITRDGVTLDCADHKITGDGHGRGIVVDKRSNVTVTNCDVSNFGTGISVAGTTRGTFAGNRLHDNHWSEWAGIKNGTGIFVQSSRDISLLDNHIYDNDQDGMLLRGSSNNLISGNEVYENGGTGVTAWKDSNGNTFQGNDVSRNADFGMAIWFNRDNTLRGNTANDNGGDGFNISASPEWPSSTNELTDNTATGNGGVGFNLNSGTMANVLTLNTANTNGIAGFVVLDASSANELRENAANGNVRFGFAVTADAVSNTLTQNVACDNPEWDAIQFEPNLGNVWTDNAFCTSSGIPIQYTWDLVKDWRNAPDQLNPSPDAYGNPGAWSYMASGSLAHDPARRLSSPMRHPSVRITEAAPPSLSAG